MALKNAEKGCYYHIIPLYAVICCVNDCHLPATISSESLEIFRRTEGRRDG